MKARTRSERRERRGFSAEFKAEAVRMVEERRAAGATLAQIGRELDVRPDQLRAWARQQRAAQGGGGGLPGETLEQENRRLRRENATLHQEQAFAKNEAATLAASGGLKLRALPSLSPAVWPSTYWCVVPSPSKNMARGCLRICHW